MVPAMTRVLQDRGTLWLGVASTAGAILGLLVWPFLGASWFNDEDNLAEQPAPARLWANALTDGVPAAFDWGTWHDAYLLYGRIFAFVFPALLAGVIGLHRLQKGLGGRTETIGFWMVGASLTLMTLGAFMAFYTPLLDIAFLAFLVPAMLLTMVGFPVFGIGTYKARVVPRTAALLMIFGALPGFPLLSWLLGHNSAAFIVIEAGLLIAALRIVSIARTPAPAHTARRVQA
jgi:hypothetical protein